jgi:hypothetical protein
MRFLISKSSDCCFNDEREINTLEDLKALEKEHPGWHGKGKDKDFIINFGNDEVPARIIIYDDWIE